MFRFIKKPLSGSHSQCLAKIKRSGSELRQTLCRRPCYGGIALTTSAWHLSQLWTTSCNFR